MGHSIRVQVIVLVRPILVFGVLLCLLSACSWLSGDRTIYNQQGVRIGVERDPTVARADPPSANHHPAELNGQDLEALLRVIQVSGWSGTLVGIVESPHPIPLFTEQQLATIAGPLAMAFAVAKPTERVFFSLPKPDVSYSPDRTEGALFLRGRYLHVVVTDHSAFLRADTGGGDEKDIRDTKGMKLWTARPAQAAAVPDAEEPRWPLFEPVHLSLNVKNVLSALAASPSVRMRHEGGKTMPGEASTPRPDLQNQIRELSNSNLELKDRLEEQQQQMKTLTDEMNRLRQELDQSKAARPSRKAPMP